MNSYDRVQYVSEPFPESQPDRLAVIGLLFGLQPCPVETAAVLELGCASGNNIIPLACSFPQSRFIGIDSSAVQIERASQTAAELGLLNIEFRCIDLLEYQSEEQFDYLICHGTLSWVGEAVQNRIFEIFASNLTPEGLGYISYNCFPGWHLRMLLREMLLYHSGRFKTDTDRIRESKQFAEVLARSLKSQDQNETKLMRNAAAAVSKLPDWYLFHDLLEEANHPIYFWEFINSCLDHGLSYIADSDIQTALSDDLGPEAEQDIQLLTRNDLEREQYLDFLRLRVFRRSIVCRSSASPRVQPALSGAAALYFAASLRRENHRSGLVRFENAIGNSLDTRDPGLIAVLERLSEEYPRFLSQPELSEKPVSDEIIAALIQGFLSGVIEMRTTPLPIAAHPGEKPEAFLFARCQARNSGAVANLKHESVKLEGELRDFIQLLDGTRDLDALERDLKPTLDVLGVAASKSEIRLRIKTTLDKLAQSALLVG